MTLRTLGKGNCEGGGVVCYVKIYTNIFFLFFFIDFRLIWDVIT
jgi:hypothetical protein